MSKFKPQVRDESKVRVVEGLARGGHGLSGKSIGVVSMYATADLPVASGLEDGLLAFDTTKAKLQITVSGSWVDAA
jgi:hypothetical protein